jgi:hypothetical protein
LNLYVFNLHDKFYYRETLYSINEVLFVSCRVYPGS